MIVKYSRTFVCSSGPYNCPQSSVLVSSAQCVVDSGAPGYDGGVQSRSFISNLHLIKLPKLLETEPLLLQGRTMIILKFFFPRIESVLYYKKTLILTVGTLPDAQEIYGQYDFLL